MMITICSLVVAYWSRLSMTRTMSAATTTKHDARGHSSEWNSPIWCRSCRDSDEGDQRAQHAGERDDWRPPCHIREPSQLTCRCNRVAANLQRDLIFQDEVLPAATAGGSTRDIQ